MLYLTLLFNNNVIYVNLYPFPLLILNNIIEDKKIHYKSLKLRQVSKIDYKKRLTAHPNFVSEPGKPQIGEPEIERRERSADQGHQQAVEIA